MSGELRRRVASASVGGSGVVILAVMVLTVFERALPPVGLVIAGFGGAIGTALCLGGYAIHRSDLTARQALRVAGWNLLGVVVLSAAVALVAMYQAAVGTPVTDPVFAGTVLVGVSAVAHVLIGYNDVKRIRARQLARERRKLAVLGRLVRHNFRSTAQVLYGYADRVRSLGGGATDADEIGDRIHDTGEGLSEMHEQIALIQRLVDDAGEVERVDLRPVVERVVDDIRTDHPDAAVTVDGPGIPEGERAVVLGEREITQLSHGSGIGLWLVRWILDAADGRLDIEDRPDGSGSIVTLRLRPA